MILLLWYYILPANRYLFLDAFLDVTHRVFKGILFLVVDHPFVVDLENLIGFIILLLRYLQLTSRNRLYFFKELDEVTIALEVFWIIKHHIGD